jgi:hypothetical protein
MSDQARHDTSRSVRLRRLTASLVFTALLLALLGVAGAVVKPARRGNTPGGSWHSFLTQPRDTVDVMFFGTSHIYAGIDPASLWRDRGLTSFVLAGPEQSMQVTEFWVREAFRHQHPKVIVVDALGMTYPSDKYNASYNQMNVNYMPMTVNRLGAGLIATPLGHRTEVLVDLWAYHDRWRSLVTSDYDVLHKQWGYEYYKGFIPLTLHRPVGDHPKPSSLTTASAAAVAYNLPALKSIAAECRKNDAQLLLLLTPAASALQTRAVLEAARAGVAVDYPEVRALDLAAPGAVPQLSFETDFFDPGHVTCRGAEKVAAPLALFLAHTYGLPDHSKDPRYAQWTADALSRDADIAVKIRRTMRTNKATVPLEPWTP